MDALFDLMVKEQLLNCLPEEVRVWIRERKPKDSEEAGELAEAFLQAGDTPEGESRSKLPKERRQIPPSNCPRCGLAGHWASDCPKPREKREGNTNSNPSNPSDKSKKQESDIYCFTCKEKGHMSFKCPKSSGLFCEESEPETHTGTTDVCRSGCVRLLGGNRGEATTGTPALALVATTRAQAKQQHRQRIETEEREQASGVIPSSVDGTEEETDIPCMLFDFDASLFSGSRGRPRLTRLEKRRGRQTHATQETGAIPPAPVDLSAEEISRLQAEDPTLEAVRNSARGGSKSADRGYFERDGLLYRRYIPPGCEQGEEEARAIEQLVLPKPCRGAVLRMAHRHSASRAPREE